MKRPSIPRPLIALALIVVCAACADAPEAEAPPAEEAPAVAMVEGACGNVHEATVCTWAKLEGSRILPGETFYRLVRPVAPLRATRSSISTRQKNVFSSSIRISTSSTSRTFFLTINLQFIL